MDWGNSLSGAAYLDDITRRTSMVNRETNLINNMVNRAGVEAGAPAYDTASFEDIIKKTAPQAVSESPPLPRSAQIDKTDKLYEQCLELEIFLVKTLISSMRSTVQKSGLVDEGFAGKMYEDMLYDEYAREFTKNAHFGMAELAYLELSGQRGKTIGDQV